MNRRIVCLVTVIMIFVVLSGCGNAPPSPYHVQVLGHRAVLSTEFVGNNIEEVTLSSDDCVSVDPAFVKTPLFGTTSFQIDNVSCPEGYATVVGDADSSGNITNVRVILPLTPSP